MSDKRSPAECAGLFVVWVLAGAFAALVFIGLAALGQWALR